LQRELPREHVAHKEHLRPLNLCVRQGGQDRVHRQVTQRTIPMLTHRDLTDASNANVSHGTPYSITI